MVVTEAAWRLTDREDCEQNFLAREHRASVEILLDFVCAQQLITETSDWEAAAIRSSARKYIGALQVRFLTKLRALQRDPTRYRISEIEMEILRARTMSEFSHSLDPERTCGVPIR